MRSSRIAALVMGCLLMIPAIGLLFGGGALGLGYGFGRGDDGYFDSTLDRLETDTVAITADEIGLVVEPRSPEWVLDALDTDLRIRATNAAPEREVFVGIGRQVDVEAYLDGVAHAEVIDVTNDLEPVYRNRTGLDNVEPPADQDFWAASATGSGTQDLEWKATSGRWSVVVMNADAAPGVAADVNVGAKAAFVLPLALIMFGVGAVMAALSVVGIVFGARDATRRTEAGEATSSGQVSTNQPASAAAHPVSLTAQLDPKLSRWKWLVKWFLAIPHFIVLAFLWLAFVVLTLVAAVAIIGTGRYPRTIFDFNVGVLRWSWRVSYYATTGGVGTDRYPPFSLQPELGDAAHLDVVYPETLSRGLVFVKWFLAIPQLLIVALLTGAWVRWLATSGDGVGFRLTGGGGLLGVLVPVAGIVLLVTGRYPTVLFDLIVGFNRWIYRTVAYVALMTDSYPPFRLDQGGNEPTQRPSPTPPKPTGPPRPTVQPTIDAQPDGPPERVREGQQIPT